MTESDIIKLVRSIIRQELAPILMGTVIANKDQNRTTVQRYKSEGAVSNLRNIQPYGISSRAPAGKGGIIIPVNGDPTHLNMVGCFDEERPTGNDGETLLYNEFGQLIYLSDGKIQIGTKASAENLVLGQIFKAFQSQFLQLMADHKHIDSMGYLTQPPDNKTDILDLKASPIDDEAILSDLAFTEKG